MSEAGLIIIIVAVVAVLAAPRAVFSVAIVAGAIALLVAAWGAGLDAGFMGVLGALVATSFIFGCSISLLGAIWASKY